MATNTQPAAAARPAQTATEFYYCDYFLDPSNNLYSGNYVHVLEPYTVLLANQNVLPPAQVQTLALSGQTQIVLSAFLLQLVDGNFHAFLQLAKFNARVGLPATPWDNQLFAQKGDLFHNQPQVVYWSLRVSTPAAIDTALAGDPNAEFWALIMQGMPTLSSYNTAVHVMSHQRMFCCF